MMVRAFMQSFLKSSKNQFVCPRPKNVLFKITNLTITDQFFPPMSFETKFKLNLSTYGKIKDRNGWTFMYSLEFFVRYKK
jgi:hypothetical protein